MSLNRTIKVFDQIPAGDYSQDITGENDSGGTKRGAHVVDLNAAQSAANNILMAVIDGTLPRYQYDAISLSVSGTDYTYTFKYDTVRQFEVLISDPAGNFTTSITEINNLLDETGSDVFLLEDSSELLLEG